MRFHASLGPQLSFKAFRLQHTDFNRPHYNLFLAFKSSSFMHQRTSSVLTPIPPSNIRAASFRTKKFHGQLFLNAIPPSCSTFLSPQRQGFRSCIPPHHAAKADSRFLRILHAASQLPIVEPLPAFPTAMLLPAAPNVPACWVDADSSTHPDPYHSTNLARFLLGNASKDCLRRFLAVPEPAA